MQRQNGQPVQSASDDRVLSLRAVRIHNAHISGGKYSTTTCPVCSQGLEGFMASPALVAPPEVAEGDGDDKEGNPPSPRSPWDDPARPAD